MARLASDRIQLAVVVQRKGEALAAAIRNAVIHHRAIYDEYISFEKSLLVGPYSADPVVTRSLLPQHVVDHLTRLLPEDTFTLNKRAIPKLRKACMVWQVDTNRVLFSIGHDHAKQGIAFFDQLHKLSQINRDWSECFSSLVSRATARHRTLETGDKRAAAEKYRKCLSISDIDKVIQSFEDATRSVIAVAPETPRRSDTSSPLGRPPISPPTPIKPSASPEPGRHDAPPPSYNHSLVASPAEPPAEPPAELPASPRPERSCDTPLTPLNHSIAISSPFDLVFAESERGDNITPPPLNHPIAITSPTFPAFTQSERGENTTPPPLASPSVTESAPLDFEKFDDDDDDDNHKQAHLHPSTPPVNMADVPSPKRRRSEDLDPMIDKEEENDILRDGTWINAKWLNNAMQNVCELMGGIHVFDSSVLRQMAQPGFTPPPTSVDRVWECSRVFIPMHVSNNHWVLSVMSHTDRVATDVNIYDSLPSDDGHEEAQRLLGDFLGAYLRRTPDLVRLAVPCAMSRQPNGNDCGVYVFACAVFKAAGREMPARLNGALWRKIMVASLGGNPGDYNTLFSGERNGTQRIEALPQQRLEEDEDPFAQVRTEHLRLRERAQVLRRKLDLMLKQVRTLHSDIHPAVEAFTTILAASAEKVGSLTRAVEKANDRDSILARTAENPPTRSSAIRLASLRDAATRHHAWAQGILEDLTGVKGQVRYMYADYLRKLAALEGM
ncbi:hypothetical protein ColTof4_14429 [Colletotrichum tofieldiae]|nr:hypothetical protein ColTof3_14850 [Colletotrichum tofieldiae]GKT82006.1 hypothetical protein ColTof4_14429 [Colletotrichum tofieldiae]